MTCCANGSSAHWLEPLSSHPLLRGIATYTGCHTGQQCSKSQDGIPYQVDVRVKFALTTKYWNISNVHCFFAWYTAIIRKTCCLTTYIKTFLFPQSILIQDVFIYFQMDHYHYLSLHGSRPEVNTTLSKSEGGPVGPQTSIPSIPYLSGAHSPKPGICLLRE